MRRRRLIVIVFLVLVVLIAGGVTTDRVLRNHRLAQQRSDYAAGLDASHRADCARALPLLSAARQGGSTRVRAAAVQERHVCENLQLFQARTADQVPTAALISWIGYLSSGPPKPFQAIAVKASRTVVTSGPLNKIMTAPLCRQRLELAQYGILTTKRSDPLAADFMSACAAAQAKSDPTAALRLYTTLRTEYPKTAAKPAVVNAFGRLISSRLTPEGVKSGARIFGYPRPLGGKTRLVARNGQAATSLEMILAGAATRTIKVKACKGCVKVSTAAQGLSQCDRPGSDEKTVTLPAGKYSWAHVDKKSMENLWVERWNLKPNYLYNYCWWSEVDTN
ncbi:MAG TPA: hypothetical protein VLL08_05690 [Kineosporiaceae bacterium]|nr:hypothetical protein [Kineosporiaceae bacterium]